MLFKSKMLSMLICLIIFNSCGLQSSGFDFSILENAVVEETLSNGLKILILPRHDAPVVSFITWANVGGADDPKEYTGLAHMFEHMAFKGTTTIGSKNLEEERKLMDWEDEVFAKLRTERLKGILADQDKIASLSAEMTKAVADAYAVIEPNAFTSILQREGGVGLNAFTSRDQTGYTVSLPSNKLELWMVMESERFLNPLLREMYKEREVVAEERRMTADDRPVGKLVEEFLGIAFKAHPYRVPIVGHMSDIQNYSRDAAKEFFERYYSPGNLTIAIVGDVKPETVIEMSKKYWERIPARPLPERIATVEPEQCGERRVIIEDRAQPALLLGWHIPEATHPDISAIEALCDILGQGRTSRLYKRMIKKEKKAVSVSAFSGFPGNKYPSLAAVFAFPAKGHSNEECEKIILAEIEKFKSNLLSKEDLDKVKARAMASLVRSLQSNSGLAQQLVTFQQIWGDWRQMFRELDRINAVVPEDVQRVAKQYFTRKNMTVASLETIEMPEPKNAPNDKPAGK